MSSWVQLMSLIGPEGPAGPAPEFAVETETLEAGATATVTVTGEAPNFVLHFGVPAGAAGVDGKSVSLHGTYPDTGALRAEHPTGTSGDAYLVAGDMVVWSATEADWVNVGHIQGPKGDKGDQGLKGDKGDQGDRGNDGLRGTQIKTGYGTPSDPETTPELHDGDLYINTASGAGGLYLMMPDA